MLAVKWQTEQYQGGKAGNQAGLLNGSHHKPGLLELNHPCHFEKRKWS